MLCKCTAFGKKDDVSQIEESRVSEKALQQFICLQGFVFKPKYWAICLKKKKKYIYIYIYIYTYISVLFFSLLLHRLAVRISLPFRIFLQV